MLGRLALLGCFAAVLYGQGVFHSHYVVHGQVMIEGYGPAAHAVVMAGRNVGRADSQGKFSVAGTVQGAAHIGVTIQAPGCEGRSVTVASPAGSVDMGIITLKPLHGRSGGGMLSFSSYAAPPAVQKLREQAQKSVRSKRLAQAQRDLEKALALYEKDAGLWHDLGQVKKAAGDEAGAQADFEKARTIEPRFVPPLVQLATLALRRENWQAVVEYGQEAVAINPVDYPETWLYLATARLKLGDSEQAERDARKAIDGSKPVLKAHHILGVALALQNRTEEAIEQLRIYVQRAPKGPETEAVRRQIEALEAERR